MADISRCRWMWQHKGGYMATMTKEIEVETVGGLRRALTMCPDNMPVYDAVGELLILRIYEEDANGWVEAA